MSIKLRLTLAVVACLAVATAILGGVTVRSTRASLLDNVDDRLIAASTRIEIERFEREEHEREEGEHGELPEAEGSGDATDPRFREIAEVVYSTDGAVVLAAPAGFPDDPEPYPELPAPGSEQFAEHLDHIVTVPAAEGDLRYRVLTQRLGGDFVRVLATPLRDVDRASDELLRTVLLTAGAVLLVGAAFSWWTIRRGLRPVDRMIDTASKIAAGDLSQRVDHRDDRSELGRLATALDEMLAQLETAFAEREENQARLKRFVADASHELRTPVSAIRGYAELYTKGGLADQETLDRAMARIHSESIRMGRLVDDLLLLARLDQQQPLELSDVDLGEIARDAVVDLRATEPACGISLDVLRPARVTGDEPRLRQVLANLLANACTHTPAGTAVRVTVDTGADPSEVVVTVADDGPGISREDQERIFERFYRADPSRSRRSGGTGLGLAIVAAVVAAHGGTVSVDSAPGEGARFHVRLPVAGPPAPETATVLPAGTAGSGGPTPEAEPVTG